MPKQPLSRTARPKELLDPRHDLAPYTPPVAERRHDSQYILLWQTEGTTDVLLEDTLMTLTAGRALWIPRFLRHSITVARNSVVVPLFLPIIAVPHPIDEPVVITVDAKLERLLLATVVGYYSILTRPEDLAERIVSLIHDHIAAPQGLPLPESAEIGRIARALIIDPADARTLRQWAQELHLGDRALARAFVRETGLSWNDWRLHCRMLRAARLLRSGEGSVATVARVVGYQTHSAFTRAFQRHFQMTPRAFAVDARKLNGRI